MAREYESTDKFCKNLKEGTELHDGYLLIKAPCENNMDIRVEEILDRHQAKIAHEEWQSKVNFYISYDYEPFSTDLFLHLYVIKGKQKYLEWLQGKIKWYFDCVNKLEFSYTIPLLPKQLQELIQYDNNAW